MCAAVAAGTGWPTPAFRLRTLAKWRSIMGFFPEPVKDEECLAWSQRLRALAVKHHRSGPIPDLNKWVRVFLTLKKERGPELVEQTLTWYEKHAGEEFVPLAFNAHLFSQKFAQIVRAASADYDPAEKVDDRMDVLAARLINDVPYPVEIIALLPSIAHRSFLRWLEFLTKVTSWTLHNKAETRSIDFLKHIEYCWSPCFIENWLRMLSVKYGRLGNYTMPPLGLAFKPESELFLHSFWQQWSLEWSGDPHTFDELLKTLTGKKEPST
jgi:hypothetical protein